MRRTSVISAMKKTKEESGVRSDVRSIAVVGDLRG